MNLLLVLSSHVSLLYLHLGVCFYTTGVWTLGHVIKNKYLNAETAVLFGQSSQRKVIPHPYRVDRLKVLMEKVSSPCLRTQKAMLLIVLPLKWISYL